MCFHISINILEIRFFKTIQKNDHCIDYHYRSINSNRINAICILFLKMIYSTLFELLKCICKWDRSYHIWFKFAFRFFFPFPFKTNKAQKECRIEQEPIRFQFSDIFLKEKKTFGHANWMKSIRHWLGRGQFLMFIPLLFFKN